MIFPLIQGSTVKCLKRENQKWDLNIEIKHLLHRKADEYKQKWALRMLNGGRNVQYFYI